MCDAARCGEENQMHGGGESKATQFYTPLEIIEYRILKKIKDESKS